MQRDWCRQLFGSWSPVLFDMHHMPESAIPSQATLRLVFDLERVLVEPTRHVAELAQRIAQLPVQTEIATLYGAERAQGLANCLARFAATAMQRWKDVPTDWNLANATAEELQMISHQVAVRYPSLRQEGRMEGRMEMQLEYVEQKYGREAREAIAELLPAPEGTRLTDLDALAQAYQDGHALRDWWHEYQNARPR